MARERTPATWAVRLVVAGAVGVAIYVGSWALAGTLIDGFDPLRQAISETFAVGVPTFARRLVTGALLLTGILLIADGPALHHALPGESRTGPVLVVIAGIGTVAVALAPCSAVGCPGAATSTTDAVHTVAAAVGYMGLTTAPLAFAVRLRHDRPTFATVSAALGAIAVLGFSLRYLGQGLALPGLQQRIFNTVADLWYVAAALEVVGLRRSSGDQ